MPSPVPPSEFQATLATTTGGTCDRLLRALFTFPSKFLSFYEYLFNEDGTLSDEFKTDLCAIDCAVSGGVLITAPTLTVGAVVTGQVVLTWSATPGAAYYEVARATGINNVNEAVLIKGTTLLTYTDTTTVDDTWYFYFVRGRSATTVGSWSAYKPGYSSAAPPLALTAPTVSTTTNIPDYTSVSWSAIAGASSYQIRRNTANNFAAATILGTTNTLFYNDFSGGYNVSYYYFAMAVNALVNSAGSTGVVGKRF